MAINKNFVIKNGLEVDTSLIFADASTSKVGIGTTIANYTLDILGGIGATDLNITGVSTVTTLNVDTKINVGTAITIDSTSGVITATKFVGDGSGLSGLSAISEGIQIKQDGSLVGTGSTIDFFGATVTSSGGISTVTVISDLIDDTTPQLGGTLDLNSNDITGTGNFNVTGIVTATALEATNLNITGVSTLTFTALNLTELQIGGGTTVTSIDTDLSSVSSDDDTLASAKAIQSYAKTTTEIENIIYVTKDGSDSNSGENIKSAKATIAGAIGVSTTGTTIRVSAGSYVENNPIALPEQVSIVGDSLREVSVSPQNSNEDLFHVANGDYISDMSFTGTLDAGKAVFAFNPTKVGYFDQSPYIQNCTNFIPNSIGLKIDGSNAVGRLKSMVLDSYTQYNQGGIGASITNEGYAQLVSMFTICDEIAVYTGSGGQCDLTNSNSSFGDFGLVSDGVSALKNTGIVTTAAAADATEFVLNVGVSTVGIDTVSYNNVTGLTTITTLTSHGFNVGMSVTMRDMTFSCSSGGVESTQLFPSGNYGYIFDVDKVNSATQFEAYVGPSTLPHSYQSGGVISINVDRPFDGQVVYIDELYYTVSKITITNEGSGYTSQPTITIADPSEDWGVTATATAIFDSDTGKVTGATIVSSGRGYSSTAPTVTFSDPQSGLDVATGTAELLPTYYSISSSTPISYIGSGTTSGICTITINEGLPYAVGVGTTVAFQKQSRIIASSHSFEYVGTGRTIATALPQNGGVLIPENEVDNRNGGLVIYTSTDQTGNFRIGDGVTINQAEGTISGNFYSRSLFSTMTPFILALGGD